MMSNTKMKRNIFFAVVAVFVAVAGFTVYRVFEEPVHAEFKAGKAAYRARDFKSAVKHYKLAAEQGHIEAMFELYFCYVRGIGTDGNPDWDQALYWLHQAAERGYAEAQAYLGVHYRDGTPGVPKDKKQAFFWFRKAADQDNITGQYMVGKCYEDGVGVDPDIAEALKWYRLAADQGNDYAQYELGKCYQEGKGVEKDMAEAVKLYRLASKQGNPRAKGALKELNLAE